jgi:hypothetical protein
MSKRHQSSRRKAYGRRQHEVRERQDRVHHPDTAAFDLDEWSPTAATDPLRFMDPSAPRLRFAMGD